MKNRLAWLLMLPFVMGCAGNEEDPLRYADIIITISASDNSRPGQVETIVYGNGLELRTNSSGNSHLPYVRTYIGQRLPDPTTINLSYRDNSAVPIGASFVPYTLDITIEVDAETAFVEQYTIHEQGNGPSVTFSVTDYLNNR